MIKTERQKSWYLNEFTLVIAIFLVGAALSFSPVFSYIDWKLYDSFVNVHRSTPEHRDNVAVVCVDQKSLDFFAEQYSFSWPLPRMFHGILVDYLSASGAKAIVFDVLFSEQDIDRSEVTSSESDNAFAESIARAGNVYLAVAGQAGISGGNSGEGSPLYLDDSDAGLFQLMNEAPSYDSGVFPLQKFFENAKSLGIVNMLPERDGIHRGYPMISNLDGRPVPSLAYTVVKDILSKDELTKNVLRHVGDGSYFNSDSKFFLNWYGNGGTGRGVEGSDAVFNYYSYAAVIASHFQLQNGETPVIDTDVFRDKIVIIGSNAPGLFDLKATPFTHESVYPGLEIHATAIENMLSGEYVTRIPAWLLLLTMFSVAMALFYAERFFSNLRIFILVYIILSLAILTAGYLFLVMNLRWIAAAELFANSTLVFAGLVISGYFKETREKRVLKNHFGRYVNDTVLKEILDNPNAVNFKGKDINATIMATDIAGFTTISEKLSADEVVSRLNDYLSEVSESLIDNAAYINKYIGDAILALFGAFEEPEHERNACYAAYKAKLIIDRKIAEAEKTGDIPLITRFGITTGDMTLGNIGSERKIEYTVIGDTVNTAFRLEGLNKFYHTRIIVGETTRYAVGESFEFRLLDELKVKGKETSEEVFELLGPVGECDPKLLKWRDEFEAALKLYRNREFQDAITVFQRLADEGDETSDVFAWRCQGFIKEPPPSEWNGVWVMLRK